MLNNAASHKKEIITKHPDMGRAQLESLVSYLCIGWSWDGEGANGSQNISRPQKESTGRKRAYIRTDGVCRDA